MCFSPLFSFQHIWEDLTDIHCVFHQVKFIVPAGVSKCNPKLVQLVLRKGK